MALTARLNASPTSQNSIIVLYTVQGCHALGGLLAMIAFEGKNNIVLITVCGIAAMLFHLVGQFISMRTTVCEGQNFRPEYPGAVKTVDCLDTTLWIFFLGVEAFLLAGLVVIFFNITVGKGLFAGGAAFSVFTFFAARYYNIIYAVGTGDLKEKLIPELKA